MSRKSVLIVAAAAALSNTAAVAQDARSIMETARQKQLERWEGVDAYVVDQSTMGQAVSTWFVRTEVEQPDGSMGIVFLPMSEIQLNNDPCGIGQMTDEDLAVFSAGSTMAGDAMGSEIDDGLAAAGLPPGLLAATGSDPWNTMDPRVMMGGYSDFLTAAVHSQREMDAYDPDTDAQAKLDELAGFLDNATLVGTETVDGRTAFHLNATGINQVQKQDGQEYHMESISLFVDSEMYVPLMMRVDGTMVSGNESQPMTLENSSSDYRKVPGSNLYESYRQVMKMSGIMTAEQEAQMQEAQAQMVEFEQQMASMPDSQRQMMEKMMGPQLETMRSMSKGNGFQTEIIVSSIRVNPAMNDTSGQACPSSEDQHVVQVPADELENPAPVATPTAAPESAPGVSAGNDLTKMVQTDLTALGYSTGNTNGEMETATIVAISKFQAENNMSVTGEVSPQLAGILAARVSAVNNPPAPDPAVLQAAQQECLQKKMEEAQAAQKKKRGFGRLLSGVGKLAGQTGNIDLASQTGDIYQAGSTAEDFTQAAKDLGLTEDDVASCQTPI